MARGCRTKKQRPAAVELSALRKLSPMAASRAQCFIPSRATGSLEGPGARALDPPAAAPRPSPTRGYTDDQFGRSESSPVRLRCACTSSPANALPANHARLAWGRFVPAQTAPSQPLTGCARSLQEAPWRPQTIRPSTSHLLRLRCRAFLLDQTLFPWASLTSAISYHTTISI